MNGPVLHSYAAGLKYAETHIDACADTLASALAYVPAYATWRTFDPGPTKEAFVRLAQLPWLTKADMRAATPAGLLHPLRDLADALARGEIELVETSGSTGDRVTNAWHQPWWDQSEAASWRMSRHLAHLPHADHREAILVSPLCTGFACEDGLLSRERRTSGRFLYLNERPDPTTWTAAHMDRMVTELDDFLPLVLEGSASFLARLARHIVRTGRRVNSPAAIILTYENASLLQRRQIAQAFDCPIVSSYGSTEAGYVFMECEAGKFHQLAGCHVDFLPFTHEHGDPDLGRILVTTFDNPWRTLLRFDIGDLVRVAADACPCGRRGGLVLDAIEGRASDLTLTPDGRAVAQSAVDRALSRVEGLDEYQWVQDGPRTYTLSFAAEPGHTPVRVGAAAKETLAALFGTGMHLRLCPQATLRPDPPGKHRLTRNMWMVPMHDLLDTRYARVRA